MIASVSSSPTSAPSTQAKAASTSARQSQASAIADNLKLQQAQTALTTLKASTDKKTDPQKAAQAKAKLDALRKRLQALMMMGGDPKTVAKQAAQIAKEIGRAAKDYADATGDGSSAAAPAAPAASAGSADTDQTSGGQPADGQTADGQAADGQAQAAAADPNAQIKAEAQGVITSLSGPDVAAKMKKPDDVIEAAKSMAASAKALIRSAQARAKHEHKDGPEFRDAQQAAEQTDKDIAEASKTLGLDDPLGGYTASGAATPAAETTPAVSVQA